MTWFVKEGALKKILAAIYLVSLCSSQSFADEQQQLIGVWKLQTYVVEFQDTDERKEPFGAHPNGYAIFTAEGRTMVVMHAEGRRPPETEADRAAAFTSTVAYTGTFRVEGDHWITKVDAAWNEAWVGTGQLRFFRVDQDELVITSNWRPYPLFDGRVARGLLTWTRAR